MEKIHFLRPLSVELGISYWTLRYLCRTRKISFCRTLGGKYCLSDKQVEELLERMRQNGDVVAPAKTH